tara:strand:+ start:15 stop:599 length:585 start_codon:yes stop_codon:yes gene_type:complete
MVNLFTGSEKGFLGSNIKKNVKGVNLHYGNILKKNIFLRKKCNNIYHFAGPSDDFDFKNSKKTVETITIGTINMLELARKNKAKFIFASTKGVENPNNIYCYSKLLMEKYIQDNYDNWVILRIPRVYDKTRKKGLMKKLRLNMVIDDDMSIKIEYLTLNSFIKQTLKVVNQCNVIYNYSDTNVSTIYEIKDLYT